MRLRSRPATLVSLATLAAAASLAAPAAAQTAPEAETAAVPAVEIVASYPSGTFLENLLVDGDRVLFTSYLDRRLMAWDGEGEPSVLAGLDTHPVGLASVGDRIVASAHGAPFTEGPTFTATNRFLVLDRDGAVISETPAPDALFLNGLVALPSGAVLAADSLAGRIWRFDPASGAIETWLEDEALRPVEGSPRPGANGLKLAGDALLVSNSARGALLRVPLDGEAPAGPPETVAETGPIDDFAVLAGRHRDRGLARRGRAADRSGRRRGAAPRGRLRRLHRGRGLRVRGGPPRADHRQPPRGGHGGRARAAPRPPRLRPDLRRDPAQHGDTRCRGS